MDYMNNVWLRAFVHNKIDGFCIFQLEEEIPDWKEVAFQSSICLERRGLIPEYKNYTAVYSSVLLRNKDSMDVLEDLYVDFNIHHPSNFRGHSLSVSDIVAIKRNGVVRCYYVDSMGFTALSDFWPGDETVLETTKEPYGSWAWHLTGPMKQREVDIFLRKAYQKPNGSNRYDYAIYGSQHKLYDRGHLDDCNLSAYDVCEKIMRMYHLNGMTTVAVDPDTVLMIAGE